MEHYPLQMGLFSVAVLVAILFDEIEVRKREKKRQIQSRQALQLPESDSTGRKGGKYEHARRTDSAETPA